MRNGDTQEVQSPVDVTDSPTDMAVVESPTEELVFDSPVEHATPPQDGSTPAEQIHDLAIDSPPSHSTDPRAPAAPEQPLTKSDSAIPAMRSPSPKQIYDVMSTSPTASACETPCVDRTHHKALHRGEAEGFFPLQEEREEEAESPGGLHDDAADWAGHEGTHGERDRQAEQEHVDSMRPASQVAVSHSTESLHALRKQSEGYSPFSTRSGDQTPAALRPDKGKERMLSVDDGVSEGSVRGRAGPGHHRRESSTHRYVPLFCGARSTC